MASQRGPIKLRSFAALSLAFAGCANGSAAPQNASPLYGTWVVERALGGEAGADAAYVGKRIVISTTAFDSDLYEDCSTAPDLARFKPVTDSVPLPDPVAKQLGSEAGLMSGMVYCSDNPIASLTWQPSQPDRLYYLFEEGMVLELKRR